MRDALLLTHRIPYPPNKGDKIRSYHLLRHLARDWRVHLGCFVDDPKISPTSAPSGKSARRSSSCRSSRDCAA